MSAHSRISAKSQPSARIPDQLLSGDETEKQASPSRSKRKVSCQEENPDSGDKRTGPLEKALSEGKGENAGGVASKNGNKGRERLEPPPFFRVRVGKKR